MSQLDMAWHVTTWHDMTCHNLIWHDMSGYFTTLHNMSQLDMTRHSSTWHVTTWYGMTSCHVMLQFHDILCHVMRGIERGREEWERREGVVERLDVHKKLTYLNHCIIQPLAFICQYTNNRTAHNISNFIDVGFVSFSLFVKSIQF